MATAEKLLTIEEYEQLPERDRPTELVAGRVVERDFTGMQHGCVCASVMFCVYSQLEDKRLGVATALVGVITQRNPDTVRAADVTFYSFERLPAQPLPIGYAPVSPNVIFEVVSHYDRWSELLTKTTEYLKAGVDVVCVVDPTTRTVCVFRDDRPVTVLQETDELTLPEITSEFRIPIAEFFCQLNRNINHPKHRQDAKINKI